MLLIVRSGAFFVSPLSPDFAGNQPFSVDKKFSSTLVHIRLVEGWDRWRIAMFEEVRISIATQRKDKRGILDYYGLSYT